MTRRVTGDRRASEQPSTRRMLVATRSFEYIDPYRGPDRVRAGITHVVEDHWLVLEYPDAWTVSDRPEQTLDSAPIPFETTHPSDRN